MRGRKPTPTYLKLLKGNPGKRAIRATVEPPRPAAPPPPPDFLSGYAKEESVRVSPELFALGLLTDLDTATFGAYCWACGVWHDATQALDRMAELDPKMKGLLVKGDGGPVQNPLIRIARNAADSMLRAAGEFGMTPVARARISSGVSPPSGPSKFDGLLAVIDRRRPAGPAR
jgi:P27 family predicted phage terminase small subunit